MNQLNMDSFKSTNHTLSGLVTSPRGGRVGQGKYRRYAVSVNTDTVIHGRVDARSASIVYEVGAHYKDADGALSQPPPGAPRGTSADYPTPFVLAEDFLGAARKYQNFSATFDYSSFAGVAERLAKGLAAWTLYPNVSSGYLAAGADIVVSVLGSHAAPVNSLTSSVFLPRLVSTAFSPDTFGVLVAAIAGEGARVVTDVLVLDTDGTPEVPTCAHDAMPLACVEALRIVGANMVAGNQGPLFALAVTRGIHSILSIVGHTDEGGITRDLLRGGSFAPPFGGLHYGLSEYSGLPVLASSHLPSVCAYVDGIALSTAAAVAHCDPGDTINGLWFPTVLDCSPGEVTLSSGSSEKQAHSGSAARSMYLNALPNFSDTYCRALGVLFGASGDESLASRVLISHGWHLKPTNRHLSSPTIAPFFWVEPTGILEPGIFGTVAEGEGAGSLCGRKGRKVHSAFEGIRTVGGSGFTNSDVVVRMRGARYMPFLYHWLNHPSNGIGAITLRQLDPESIVLAGSGGGVTVRERVLANHDLGSLLWVRGQSPFPAPAEALNISGAIGLNFRHASIDAFGIPTAEHLPRDSELAGLAINLSCSLLQGLSDGPSNFGPPGAARCRTLASKALASARSRALFGDAMEGLPLTTSLSSPVHFFTPAPAASTTLGAALAN